MNLIELIQWAFQKGASDIHLSEDKPICLRICGELKSFPDSYFDLSLLLTSLDNIKQQQLKKNHSVDAGWNMGDGNRVRIHIFRHYSGIGAVLRLITNNIPTLEVLPAPRILKEWIQKTQGLILVSGSTGSGKTTTLAAMISAINHKYAKHIVTLEDPIEFIHTSQKSVITQKEKHTHFKKFSGALKQILRSDPDIILVGEMRDSNTIQVALHAAETGHLVMGTLHSATAAGAVSRVIHAFPSSQQNKISAALADNLVGVASQRLIQNNMGRYEAEFEILTATPAVRQHIRENQMNHLISAIQTGGAQGMQLFSQNR